MPPLKPVRCWHSDWLASKPNADAITEMLRTIRDGSSTDTSEKAVAMLNRGVSPHSLWAAFHLAAGELLMRAPGILSLHATTFTNALHYAWQRCHDDETRKLLLLQNAAFLPLYRNQSQRDTCIDQLEPTPLRKSGLQAIEEIFSEISTDRLAAARKLLSYFNDHRQPNLKSFADAARRLIFLKGNNSHDYKFSSAVLEDYSLIVSPWRERFLAASVFYLKGTGDADNALVQRIRAAFQS